MRRPRPPVFLARRPYRQRRLRDAARLLPLLGLLLVTLPALWSPAGGGAAGDGGGGRSVAVDAVYFFAVWAILIGVAAAFAPGLAQPDDPGTDAEDEG